MKVEYGINTIAGWSDNHLVLNPAKYKCMAISRKKKLSCTAFQLLLNNHPLDQVDTFKYLGVLLVMCHGLLTFLLYAPKHVR